MTNGGAVILYGSAGPTVCCYVGMKKPDHHVVHAFAQGRDRCFCGEVELQPGVFGLPLVLPSGTASAA